MRCVGFACLLALNFLAVFAVKLPAQELTRESIDRQRFNQVFVKVIVPVSEHAPMQKGPAVESWVAKELKQLKVPEYFAVTDWVPVCDGLLADDIVDNDVWDGNLESKHQYCPVGGDIPKREDGRVLVWLSGWSPGGGAVEITLPDEPGSRVVAPVQFDFDDNRKPVRYEGYPYVAVMVAPPPHNGTTKTPKTNK